MAETMIGMSSASGDAKSGIGVEIQNPERENIRVNLPGKRKRVSAVESMTPEERDARVGDFRQEIEGLFRYYRELVAEKMNLDIRGCASSNMAVACLLEESSMPFSKLVSEIYEKMKEISEGSTNGVTLASVKISVHSVGQRSSYGLTNFDADLFEDETDSCLWCWETRDMKLLPQSSRGMIKIRRTCKKKIHERITAVTDMITTLQKSGSCVRDLTKASERLCKVLNEADIRLMAQSMVEKNSAHMGDKEVKKEEKKLIKEMEKIKWEEEKEKKRMNLELMKEKLQNEKELKRLQSEALKEERKREKEEAEHRKQLKRKQEDDEKDQRRREKEEAVQKMQNSLQKQASLMNRFLKRSKTSVTCPDGELSSQATAFVSPPDKRSTVSESVTLTMDNILSRKDEMDADDILKAHMISWKRPNRKHHWGMRQKPKSDVTKKVKLSASKTLVGEDELNLEKLDGAWDETQADERSDNTISDAVVPCIQRPKWHKQLLQFDKSNRPAFYGIRTKKSQVIGPRCPFKKDQDLDYEIDSDEEWEEEEPGESLSDCDKDDDEEVLEEGSSKVDGEDDSEDDFFVPDGYLSEDEGVQVVGMESDNIMDTADNVPDCKIDPENEQKMHVLLRQQKHMFKLTDHALRRNQPLIISNIKHEKAPLMLAEDLSGTAKLEQLCLQALSMCRFPGGPCIDISLVDNGLEEDDNSRISMKKESSITPRKVAAVSELDLREIVSTIQSHQHGINRLLESLHQKFPTIPKSQLKIKVREISEFVDNRWQVKKDVLKNLGLPISPEKGSSSVKTKSIAAFFSKTAGDGKKKIKPNSNPSLENSLPKASTSSSTAPAL
ncbi:chromatin assembly factor 1 subunit FAS1-like isoform X2 [Impatiens glandulifera]|nr:chromatin assembly factor 1 subunit FAS1-like isoform X2 [Impatiens glandulifera]